MSPQIKPLWLYFTCLMLSASCATLQGRVEDDQTGAPIATGRAGALMSL